MLKSYKSYNNIGLLTFSLQIDQEKKNGVWKKKLVMPKKWNNLNTSMYVQKNNSTFQFMLCGLS